MGENDNKLNGSETAQLKPDGTGTVWFCPTCGHANDRDGRFCTACGRQRPTQMPGAPAREKAPRQKKQKLPPTPEQKEKRKKIFLISVAAALAIFLLWCGAFHFAGKSYAKKGEYNQAISCYEKDILFSRKARREAIYELGMKYYNNGQYEKAADYFKRVGEDGYSQWSDSILARAKELIQGEKYDDAIALLTQIEDEKRGREYTGLAIYSMAQAQLAEGNYSEAKELAGQIQDTTLVDMDLFYNELYYNMALTDIRACEPERAAESLQQCKGYRDEQSLTSILNGISRKAYGDAAMEALELSAKSGADITKEQWARLFLPIVKANLSYSDMSQRLQQEAAKAVFSKMATNFGAEGIVDAIADNEQNNHVQQVPNVYTDTMIQLLQTDDLGFTFEKYTDTYAMCGNKPSGKILILRQNRNYAKGDVYKTTYCISFDLMKYLPPEYYPTELSQVSYIVFVMYDCSYYCCYGDGLIGLRESASVQTMQMPGQSQIYYSYCINGPYCPQSFCYYDAAPQYMTGGPPDIPKLAEAINKAVNAAMAA